MKFEVTVGLEKIGVFDNFFDAFKLFFEEIMKALAMACTHFFGHFCPHNSTFNGKGVIL